MNNIKILKPNIADLFNILTLFNRALKEEYNIYDQKTKQMILKRHSLLHLLIARFKPGRLTLIALDKETCVGVLLGSYSPDGVASVNWIYVLPEYRSKKIARRMLHQAEFEFKQNECHKLVVSTEVAQGFYKKIGYSQEAYLKHHWWNKDFYIFSKILH